MVYFNFTFESYILQNMMRVDTFLRYCITRPLLNKPKYRKPRQRRIVTRVVYVINQRQLTRLPWKVKISLVRGCEDAAV